MKTLLYIEDDPTIAIAFACGVHGRQAEFDGFRIVMISQCLPKAVVSLLPDTFSIIETLPEKPTAQNIKKMLSSNLWINAREFDSWILAFIDTLVQDVLITDHNLFNQVTGLQIIKHVAEKRGRNIKAFGSTAGGNDFPFSVLNLAKPGFWGLRDSQLRINENFFAELIRHL